MSLSATRLEAMQEALTEARVDGWLFTDHHGRDPLAARLLGLAPDGHATRRWFYLVPASGEPLKLVHAIESSVLDSLPGTTRRYAGWRALDAALTELLAPCRRLLMQYSPRAALPAVSLVDAGTIELVRDHGVEVLSSADMVARFEALLDEAGFESHRRAGRLVQAIKDEAFAHVGDCLRRGRSLDEFALQRFVVDRFAASGLVCDHPPVVAIDEHGADPHYAPTADGPRRAFAPGQAVLLDLWAREDRADGVYYDVTWCAWTGEDPDPAQVELFACAVRARDAALALVRERIEGGLPLRGWEVDAAARGVIKAAGHGAAFVHRTGHSIGHDVHGAGVNMDDFETRDERLVVPGCCFSIEPGIYLAGRRGVRTEIDVCVTAPGRVEVVGPIQRELVLIPC